MAPDVEGGLKSLHILVVFDHHYAADDTLVGAYMSHVSRLVPPGSTIKVVSPYSYRGFPIAGLAQVTMTAGGTKSERKGILQRFGMKETGNRLLTNIAVWEEKVLRHLMAADELDAVLVFTQSPDFALKVARWVHLFATTDVPRLVAITPQQLASKRVVADLDWLRVSILKDGEIPPVNAIDREPEHHQWLSLHRRVIRKGKGIARRVLRLRQRSVPAVISVPPVITEVEERSEGHSELVALPFSAAPVSFFDHFAYPYRVDISRPASAGDIRLGDSRPPRVRDVVLFIRPDWMSCGSGTYFESLAGYFRRSDALLIDVAVWPFALDFSPADRAAKLAEVERTIGSALYFSLRMSDNYRTLGSVFLRALLRLPKTVFGQSLYSYEMVPMPDLLKQVVRRARISKVYLNHAFLHRFAKSLIGGRKYLLDTHDLQSINFMHHKTRNAVTGRIDSFEKMLAEEMDVLKQADVVSFVSRSEIEIARNYLDPSRIIQFIALPGVTPAPERFESRASAHILLVASDNLGNRKNLDWFLDHVWPEVLVRMAETSDGRQVQLDICGSISRHVGGREIPNAVIHGVVDRLESFYEEADVVALPVVTGGGAAMKTIEALLFERPVIATKHALRGLPLEVEEAVGYCQTPAEMAEQLVEVLCSKEAYGERIRRTKQGGRALLDQQYFRAIDQALETVRTA